MRILITGATGFVGKPLCRKLARDGHQLAAWVRSVPRARAALPAAVQCFDAETELERHVHACDAIVHLAGEPVVEKRWTEKRKRAVFDSRVGLANRLAAALTRAPEKRRAFITASAVGYYGDRGDEVLREDAKPGDDFLAQLCVAWEAAAETARSPLTHVARMRTGHVLGQGGGLLGALEKPFKLGIGGKLGSGRQFVPWIALEDLVAMYAKAVTDDRVDGAFNATAPNPVTNAEFTRALGETLHRPTLLPVPRFVLRTIFGERAPAMLSSQRALPARFETLGFAYAHRDVRGALRASFEPDVKSLVRKPA
jgi:uncharacterized protein (TIGR01777 family)